MIKTFQLIEPGGHDRVNECVHVSIPFARGEVVDADTVGIWGDNGAVLPSQVIPLAYWPDGSVRWMQIVLKTDLQANSTKSCVLKMSGQPAEDPLRPLAAVREDGSISVWTERSSFGLTGNGPIPFYSVTINGHERLKSHSTGCFLTGPDGSACLPKVDELAVEVNGPLYAIVNCRGGFTGATPLRFSLRMHFWRERSGAKVEFTLHNPGPAVHKSGLWDLGDPGSVYFQGAFFDFQLNETQTTRIRYREQAGERFSAEINSHRLSIYQESSGGENWRSETHRNRNGEVPMRQKGFVVERGSGQRLADGLRADPMILFDGDLFSTALYMPDFWQSFPSEMKCLDGLMRASLFPERFPDVFELQGGEQKTQTFIIDFAASEEQLAWMHAPIESLVPASDYRHAGLGANASVVANPAGLFATARHFIEAREIIDEYGWRNFGEVFADHESVHESDARPFVSHYNNQYDLVAGFYSRFFATGDPRWKVLASDLAKHVIDIDIYHTDLDREEYNHGMFWHTDHYLDAGLATHRSYSRMQTATYETHVGGGGPSPEHCYTSGLKLHYYMTADPRFRQAVTDLAGWSLNAIRGPQTVLAALRRVSENLIDLRRNPGRASLFPRYPLNRGTGNTIVACLDSFELTGDRVWLSAVADLIRGSISPSDDIDKRGLENIEHAWSYSVFLASLGRFLDVKGELNQQDDEFDHARQSLIAYALWMARSEYLYLEEPEKLEFPNETWAAQELRKSVVFYYAAKYAGRPDEKRLFADKSRYFFDGALLQLESSEGSRLVRPVALILQNSWVMAALEDIEMKQLFPDPPSRGMFAKTPELGLAEIVNRFCRDVLRALTTTSLKKEVSWLKSRLTG